MSTSSSFAVVGRSYPSTGKKTIASPVRDEVASKSRRTLKQWLAVAAAALISAGCGGGGGGGGGGGQAALSESYSSPIAITTDNKFVWSVNPDNDTVSVFSVDQDKNQRVTEIAAGDEPRCVAITPDNKKVYVTNALSGNVYVLDAIAHNLIKTINVGAEPFGCALSLDGAKLYVANLSSDNVSVINTGTDTVTKTIDGVGPKPRGIAVASVNGAIKVYVTQFLAQLRSGKTGADEGRDDSKEGRVTVISATTDQVVGTIALSPLATGFQSDGSTLDRTIFDANNAATKFATQCFPNLMESIVVKGSRAYLPNTCSSPNGPFKFNVNVQGVMAVIDITTDTEVAAETFNMNKGVQLEAVGKKLFITNPIAVAFKKQGGFEGFVVSAATDRLVRLALDQNNKPTINAPAAAGDPGAIVRVEVGVDANPLIERNSNPQGIAINSTDTRAYVMNFITRDVSVVDISGTDTSKYKEIARMPSANLPQAGTIDAVVHRGNELFNTAIGPEGTQENAQRPAGRMSDFGWGSCYGCHPRGLADGVTWMFPDGPRQAISMESTFEHPQPQGAQVNANGAPILPAFHQRALNWSAVRDEVQDFELNIRAVSGGQGLIKLANGDQDKCVFNLRFAESADCPLSREAEAAITTGRDADLDAIAAYLAFGVRTPVALQGPNVAQGRQVFENANCHACHGGPNWTASVIDFAPPPAAADVQAGQLRNFLCKAGTFDAAAVNEFKAIGNAQTAIVPANGELGINIPSLISVGAGAPYLHSGAAQTLDEVLANVTHRSLGTNGVDTLTNAADRAVLVEFLKSIDLTTAPFDLPADPFAFCQA